MWWVASESMYQASSDIDIVEGLEKEKPVGESLEAIEVGFWDWTIFQLRTSWLTRARGDFGCWCRRRFGIVSWFGDNKWMPCDQTYHRFDVENYFH